MSIVASVCDWNATYLTDIPRTNLMCWLLFGDFVGTFNMVITHLTCDQSHLVRMPQGFARLESLPEICVLHDWCSRCPAPVLCTGHENNIVMLSLSAHLPATHVPALCTMGSFCSLHVGLCLLCTLNNFG